VSLRQRLAELAVGLGVNLQPGQTLRVSADVGQAEMVRAVAETAYGRGARFVDVNYFDPHVQVARVRHAPEDALPEIPPWEVERIRQLAADGGASIKITGPTAPGAFDELDPARLGRTSLPSIPEWREVELDVNWTVIASPTQAWAAALRPRDATALQHLWEDVGFACRLDLPDPVAAWHERLAQLQDRARTLNELRLDHVRLHGPDTDLTVGLLPGGRWEHPVMTSSRGIEHVPNLPTEEVFTSPDPQRADGHVALTRPALVGGRQIEDVRLELSRGRITSVEGGTGVEALRALLERDDGASRLGELALVDDSSRVGRLGRTFGVILLDENAAGHIALGSGFPELGDGVNDSAIHLDVMVGSPEVAVTGIDREGEERPLLRDGRWVA
jgi:aminopeptidase